MKQFSTQEPLHPSGDTIGFSTIAGIPVKAVEMRNLVPRTFRESLIFPPSCFSLASECGKMTHPGNEVEECDGKRGVLQLQYTQKDALFHRLRLAGQLQYFESLLIQR